MTSPLVEVYWELCTWNYLMSDGKPNDDTGCKTRNIEDCLRVVIKCMSVITLEYVGSLNKSLLIS